MIRALPRFDFARRPDGGRKPSGTLQTQNGFDQRGESIHQAAPASDAPAIEAFARSGLQDSATSKVASRAGIKEQERQEEVPRRKRKKKVLQCLRQ